MEWIDDPDVVDRKLVGTCASDYSNLDKWLKHAHILISYSSGPIADEENTKVLQQWLENGGRMIGIHGTSGGYARKITSNDEFKNALYPGKVHKHGPRAPPGHPGDVPGASGPVSYQSGAPHPYGGCHLYCQYHGRNKSRSFRTGP